MVRSYLIPPSLTRSQHFETSGLNSSEFRISVAAGEDYDILKVELELERKLRERLIPPGKDVRETNVESCEGTTTMWKHVT
jgi:hypothetical protein